MSLSKLVDGMALVDETACIEKRLHSSVLARVFGRTSNVMIADTVPAPDRSGREFFLMSAPWGLCSEVRIMGGRSENAKHACQLETITKDGAH